MSERVTVMIRDCNEKTALNMANDSECGSKCKTFFRVQTLGQIQQLERCVCAIKTVNVTGGDSNETRKTNFIVFNVVNGENFNIIYYNVCLENYF